MAPGPALKHRERKGQTRTPGGGQGAEAAGRELELGTTARKAPLARSCRDERPARKQEGGSGAGSRRQAVGHRCQGHGAFGAGRKE